MATSLAKQLLALSAPQTSRLTKEHAVSSFLFQPKQAAELEREDIYILAITGLEVLESIVPTFSKFKTTLFSEESKYLERSVQTKEANKSLNKEIAKFLRLLSPFFLLKPAHKALEWLIRRFQIHLYNTDELMKCVLPFYESKTFARIVQILDLNANSSKNWRWLAPFQKSGLPLPKSALINHCHKDIGFLDVICNLVKDTVERNDASNVHLMQTIASFYMSTIVGVLKQAKTVTEEMLGQIIPSIMFSLKSNWSELVSSSYIILTYISQKVFLEPSFLEPVFKSIFENVMVGLEKEAISCFAICISSQSLPSISSDCYKMLLKKNLRPALEDLSTSSVMLPILRSLTSWAFELALKGQIKYTKNAMWLISLIELTEEDVKNIFRIGAQLILNKEKRTSVPESCESIFNVLERKYPIYFDQCLEEYSKDRKSIKKLKVIMGNKSVATSGPNWLDYLNHPNAHLRKCAVEAINTIDVKEIKLKDIFLMRLKDDDPKVVHAVLSSPKFVGMLGKVGKKLLIDIICNNYHVKKWSKVLNLVLSLLTKFSFDNSDDERLITLLPLVFPMSFDALKISRKILLNLTTGPSSIFWKLLIGSEKCLKNQVKNSNVSALLKEFSITILSLNDQEKQLLLLELIRQDKFINANKQFQIIIIPLLVAEVAIQRIWSSNELNEILAFLAPKISPSVLKKIERQNLDFEEIFNANSFTDFFTIIGEVGTKNNYDLFLYSRAYALKQLFTYKQLFNCKPSSECLNSFFDHLLCWTADKNIYLFNLSKLLFRYFVDHCLVDSCHLQELLQFSIGQGDKPYLTTVYSLHLLNETLPLESCHRLMNSAIFTLLPYCNSDKESIRKASLTCLSSILTIKGFDKFLHKFVKHLIVFRQEINNDYTYLPKAVLGFINDNGHHREILKYFLNEISDGNISDFNRLGLVKCLDNITSCEVLKELLPIAKEILHSFPFSLTTYRYETVDKILRHISLTYFEDCEDFTILIEVLSVALCCERTINQDLPTIQMLALEQIRIAYDLLTKMEQKRSLVLLLLDMCARENNIKLKLSTVLREILSDGNEIAHHLELLTSASKTSLLRDMPDSANKDNSPLRLMILESVEGNFNIVNHSSVIPVLFKILEQNFNKKDQDVYELELVMGCLLEACSAIDLNTDVVNQAEFNVELLIKSLQRKASPRFHGTTLLVLSSIAQIFPEFVLRNAILVFTLMSSGTFLLQDDSYSFGIVITTLEKILPPIFNILQTSINAEDSLKAVSDWLRIFVEALPHMLDNRRQAILTTLLSSLGADNQFLWLLLATILQSYINSDSKGKFQRRSIEERKAMMVFSVEFCSQFSSSQQISASIQLIKNVINILRNKKHDLSWLNIQSEKEKHRFCHAAVIFTSSLFSSHSFLTQLIDKDDSVVVLLSKVTKVVLRLLNTAQKLSKQDKNSWMQFTAKCYQLLDKTIALVPEKMFFKIVNELLEKNDVQLQCKVVEMFTVKLQRSGSKLIFQDVESIFLCFLAIIKQESIDDSTNSEKILLQQLCLYSFKYLSRLFASQQIESFQKLSSAAVTILRVHSNEHIISSALLCLAELCQSLRAHFIVYLNKLIPIVLSYFKDESKLMKNELMLISSVTFLSKLIEYQEPFLSPYLSTILLKVCYLCTSHSNGPKTLLSSRLTNICRNISRKVEPRVLLPAVKLCYETLINDRPGCVASLMAILAEALRITNDAVGVWQEYLSNFFFDALDFRSTHKTDGEDTISLVEQSLLEPLLVLVMKMSEVTFRPFFIKFFEWGTEEKSEKERLFTFFKLVNGIADKLKSLFVLFAGQLLLHMVALMESNNSSKNSPVPTFGDETKNDILLRYVFDILLKCFVHDTQGFINKERFLTLTPSLVDQLENEKGDYNERNKHLIPCLANLTQAVTPDVNLQPYVYSILLKTRNPSYKVRCAVLETIRQIAKKLKEDFLSLLPETIPFLAELMEDEVKQVEELCHSVIADMEETVGEPLQKYFIT